MGNILKYIKRLALFALITTLPVSSEIYSMAIIRKLFGMPTLAPLAAALKTGSDFCNRYKTRIFNLFTPQKSIEHKLFADTLVPMQKVQEIKEAQEQKEIAETPLVQKQIEDEIAPQEYKDYRNIFSSVPEKYKEIVANYIAKSKDARWIGENRDELNGSPEGLQKINASPNEIRKLIYRALGDHFFGNNFINPLAFFGGYIFFGHPKDRYRETNFAACLLQGINDGTTLRDLMRYFQPNSKRPLSPSDSSKAKDMKEQLVQNYKIHLMPKQADVVKCVIMLIEELQRNKKLRQLITTFKVRQSIDDKDLMRRPHEIMPRIVIYPTAGKKEVQEALDIIRSLFKEMQGIDVTPRYNQKVTSLVYFAQGNGDHKGDNYKEFYEQPAQIYYKADFTGDYRHYHLSF